MMINALLGVILFFLQATFTSRYVGHLHVSSDVVYNEEYKKPDPEIHFQWTERSDSSWAQLLVFKPYHVTDTIIFIRPIKQKIFWMLASDTTESVRQSRQRARVFIHQFPDSISISIGHGFSGITYTGHKE